MIVLILLYLSLGSSFALPIPSDLPTGNHPSYFTHSADKFGTRSIWSIIWNCLSTLFACTWIAVHPNIPGPNHSEWAVFGKRLGIMGYVLIAPEMVIYWAARQHMGARHLTRQYHGRGWTMTHGFFIIMGGFTLHDEQGNSLRILVPGELEELDKAQMIEWPSITKKEIQDRSKSDYLAKGIVLLQTTWFITHCIVRAAYRLKLTELEVVTLAFAALTGLTYYLWWYKPLDVRCSVPVYLLKDSESLSEKSQMPQQPLVVPDESNPQGPTTSTTFAPSHNNSTPIPVPNFTRMQRLAANIYRRRQKYGAFLGLFYVFLVDPLFAFLQAFGDMYDCDTLHASSPLCTPAFYAPNNDGPFDTLVAICVGVIFGGIHCIAWSFYFPSSQERFAWRISAVFVCGFPIFFILYLFLLTRFVGFVGESSKLGKFFIALQEPGAIALTVIYIITRITLLVLPFIALRALPATALTEIYWVSLMC